MTSISLFLLLALPSVIYAADTWNYLDDTLWAQSFPDCGGRKQSPIDIETKKAKEEAFEPFKFSSAYFAAIEGELSNAGGHTLKFGAPTSENDDFLPSVSGGPLKDDEYQFAQFHFHWSEDDKAGSEHTLDGKAFPGEVHFVHYNKKHKSITKALGKKDGLAVLGFFIEVDKKAEVEGLVPGLTEETPNVAELEGKEKFAAILSDLIFHDEIDFTHYTTYDGSLTTPPCLEIVTWINFLDPIHIPEDLFLEMREMQSNLVITIDKNYRSIQDLGKRKLYINEQ